MIYDYLVTYVFARDICEHTSEGRNQEVNYYASQGWELVCVDGDNLYFKRPSESFRKDFLTEIRKTNT